jgi:hypothetical protein
MGDKRLPEDKDLPDYAVSQLLADLGLARYMLHTPCNRQASPYSPHVNGWNKGLFTVISTISDSVQNI